MALNLSEYVGKYIPLENGRLEIEKMAAYLESEGLRVERIQDNIPVKKVIVCDDYSNKYQVTVRGLVKRVGRDHENFDKWKNEQKKRKSRKGLVIDTTLMETFERTIGEIPFQTWVKRKMLEEIYGTWKPKKIYPQKDELVNGMVIIDDGDSISLCHISEFNNRDFQIWTRIPPRSNEKIKL